MIASGRHDPAKTASPSEGDSLHEALVSTWARIYREVDGARFEPRSDLILAVCPRFPIPQCNGPWVTADSDAAVEALPAAIAEVEATGERPWVQTRAHYPRSQAAARQLGLTEVARLPAMVARPRDLIQPDVDLDVGAIVDAEVEATIGALAAAFDAPRDLFARLCATLHGIPETTWYVGRRDGAIVATALAFNVEGATGIFNVGTPPEHRGRGYASAVTARAVADGFAAGAEFAFLQSTAMGHSVYRRLGFRDVGEYVLLTRPAGAAGTDRG